MKQLQQVKSMLLAMQRNPWEQGVCAQAFLENGDEILTIQLAREAVHRQAADGRPAMLAEAPAVTDPVSCGEALLFAARKTGDPLFLDALGAMNTWIDERAPRSEQGILYHMVGSREFWADSLYMLPPYLAAAGQYQAAMQQFNGYWQALFLPEKGLLAHRYDEGKKRLIRADTWGVGNGWALAGMARMLGSLPQEQLLCKQELRAKAVALLDTALTFQRSDGLFHDVIDNPATFVDTGFAQMAAYTIFRGCREGWLDHSYLAPARQMRAAARKKVDRYGMVNDVCGSPDFAAAGQAPEGQAFFVLMETEHAKLDPAAGVKGAIQREIGL